LLPSLSSRGACVVHRSEAKGTGPSIEAETEQVSILRRRSRRGLQSGLPTRETGNGFPASSRSGSSEFSFLEGNSGTPAPSNLVGASRTRKSAASLYPSRERKKTGAGSLGGLGSKIADCAASPQAHWTNEEFRTRASYPFCIGPRQEGRKETPRIGGGWLLQGSSITGSGSVPPGTMGTLG